MTEWSPPPSESEVSRARLRLQRDRDMERMVGGGSRWPLVSSCFHGDKRDVV